MTAETDQNPGNTALAIKTNLTIIADGRFEEVMFFNEDNIITMASTFEKKEDSGLKFVPVGLFRLGPYRNANVYLLLDPSKSESIQRSWITDVCGLEGDITTVTPGPDTERYPHVHVPMED